VLWVFTFCNDRCNNTNGTTKPRKGAEVTKDDEVTRFSKLNVGETQSKRLSASAIRITQLLNPALSLSIFQ
jgi:ABC-type cobalamin transport system ATPase subunit